MGQQELAITRVFDAPREKIWKAWTEPEMVKRWWGPKDFTAPHIEIAFREGGKYLFCMRGTVTPGGEKKDFWSTGTYQKIVPMEKIVATDSFADVEGNVVSASYYGMDPDWPREMTVITTFEEVGPGKTKFTLLYPDISSVKEKDLKDMTEGWNQSLNKLAESLK